MIVAWTAFLIGITVTAISAIATYGGVLACAAYNESDDARHTFLLGVITIVLALLTAACAQYIFGGDR